MAEAEAVQRASEDEEAPENNAALAKHWINEIRTAEKGQAKWVERSKKIEKIYADKRDATTARARKFNILYSNVETLRPAVYMQTPKPQVVRRYRDRDPVARLASMFLERCLTASCEAYDFDNSVDQTVRDRLLPGRGVMWVAYRPTVMQDTVVYENAEAFYVPWQDFLHSVCRVWEENRWVARRFYKTRKEIAAWLIEAQLVQDPKQAKAIAAQIQLDYTVDRAGGEKDDGLQDERNKAQIWEVHDKESGQVLYVAPGSNENAILGKKPPEVQFADFFPCPRPLLATTIADSLIPTPDYAQYQDQAEELNRITERIGVLQKALKAAGVYASESAELAQLLESGDNQMIAVKNWAMFAEGGGARGRIEWFPVEQIAIVLEQLYATREQAKQTLYEVSGIGDILRGATDPDETATAQGIKAKWGSLRVRRVQKDVQRFVADILKLKAEVIAEKFSPETILKMAGADEELLAKYLPPPPPAPQLPPEAQQLAQQNPQMVQMFQAQQQQQAQQAKQQFMSQVFELLRDDVARNYRINVETDSTLEPDMAEEKQVAIEFVTAMTGLLEKSAPMIQQGPEAAKLVGEMMLFAVRRFDKVEQLEQVIEQAMEAAAQPKPPAPDPEMVKVEAKVKESEARLQMDQRANEQEMQHKERMAGIDMQTKIMGAQVDAAVKQNLGEQKIIQGQQQMEQAAAGADQKMSIAEANALHERAMREGAPPQ